MKGEPTGEGGGIERRGDTGTMMVEMKKMSQDLYDLGNILLARKLGDKPAPEERKKFWELIQNELPGLNAKLKELVDAGNQIAF